MTFCCLCEVCRKRSNGHMPVFSFEHWSDSCRPAASQQTFALSSSACDIYVLASVFVLTCDRAGGGNKI